MRTDPIPRLKTELAAKIVERLDGWAQEWAAAWISTDQPRMSDLRNGRLERFSLERLLRFAARLHCDIAIHIVWTRPDYRQPRPGNTNEPPGLLVDRRRVHPTVVRRRRELESEAEDP